jgi:signal peptidase II
VRIQEELNRRYGLALSIAIFVVAIDLLTKRIAAVSFVDERVTVIPHALWFTYYENPGAAFSIFTDAGPVFGVAAIIAAIVILIALRSPRPRIEVIAFGMVLGGAVGNLIDRIARGEGFLDGHVIDWIQFPNFPVFNIADSSITLAVVVLFIASFRQVEVGAEQGQVESPSER